MGQGQRSDWYHRVITLRDENLSVRISRTSTDMSVQLIIHKKDRETDQPKDFVLDLGWMGQVERVINLLSAALEEDCEIPNTARASAVVPPEAA